MVIGRMRESWVFCLLLINASVELRATMNLKSSLVSFTKHYGMMFFWFLRVVKYAKDCILVTCKEKKQYAENCVLTKKGNLGEENSSIR